MVLDSMTKKFRESQFRNQVLMDILRELSPDQWPVLQKELKQLWPVNVLGYYTLNLSLKDPRLREIFQFKVYCPYGDIRNGFIGIFNKDAQHCILFSTSEDTSKLEEAIIRTKLIDWSQRVSFDFANSHIVKAFNRVNDVMSFTKYDMYEGTMYILERTTKQFTDIRLPENTYTGPVKLEYIAQVNNAWPYKYSYSHFYFTTLASKCLSYGIYSHDNELIAWVFINEYNILCHLFCEERYRKQGYAECILKIAANEQLKDGNDVYAFIMDGNEKSLALFGKIGFKACDKGAFIYVQK